MTPEMKEIALRVAETLQIDITDAEAVEFCRCFLAALPKPEPVGTFYQCVDGSYRPCPEYYEHAEKLYSEAHQDTAAIEQRVAEACAKLIRSEGIGFADDDEELNRISALIDSGKWREFL